MIRHNLLLIIRNFRRFKATFLINVVGLSSGLACALLIYLWVNDELNVDKFHKNDDRLFQVMKNNHEYGTIETDEDTPGLLARTLREEITGVEQSVSVFPPAAHTFDGILSFENNRVKAASKFADRDFFSMFSYTLILGNERQVLSDKHGVVISEAMARKLFGAIDGVLGKPIEWKGERNDGQFVVSGVFSTVPHSSSIRFDVVFNYDLLLEKFPGFLGWNGSAPSTYVLLAEDVQPAEFSRKIVDFVKAKNPESPLTLFVRPYSDRYLYGTYENGVQAGGRIKYVKFLSVIAAAIVLIACINFMNLSTARASRRFKEVGIKKAVGASRTSIATQYIGESLLTTLLALVLAILFVDVFLTQFGIVTGKQLELNADQTSLFSFPAF